ncbi:MAG: hypothetical protein WC613_03270 [Candidatus Aenigmatarchaeota archaeon]
MASELAERAKKKAQEVAKIYGISTITPEAMKLIEDRFDKKQFEIKSLIEKSQKSDAALMRSVEIVIKTASEEAKSRGQTYILSADIESAVQKNFCKVYPFCG